MKHAQKEAEVSLGLDRRSCLRLLAGATVGGAFGLGLEGRQAAAASPTTVRAGLQRGALGSLKVALPLVEGKHDVKFEQNIFNDSTAVILALQQKQLDWGNVTAQHVIRSIDEGMNLVVVSGLGGGYNVLVAGSKLDLAKGDLAGFKALVDKRKGGTKLKIGVPTGSQQHLKLITLLTSVKVDPERDVDILNVPFPDQPRALDGGQIDMAMMLAAFAALAIVNGSGKLFDHVYGPGFGQWEIGFAVRQDMVKDTPDVVQRIVATTVDAMKLFMNDLPKRLEFEKKESSFPPAVVEMEQTDFIKYSYRVAIEDLKRTAKEMHALGWAKKDHSGVVEQYVDYSFLEKATGESRQQLMSF